MSTFYAQYKNIQKQALKDAIQKCHDLVAAENLELKRIKNDWANAPADQSWAYEFIIELVEERKAEIRRDISRLTWQRREVQGTAQTDKKILEGHVQAAKHVPIQDLYEGSLRKTSGKLWGKCPFHQEKSASFAIYLNQNTFACYSCNVAGDAIEYVMKKQNLSFIQAVKFLLAR